MFDPVQSVQSVVGPKVLARAVEAVFGVVFEDHVLI